MSEQLQIRFFPLNKHEWRLTGILFLVYFLVAIFTARFIPDITALNPAYAIGIGALFFGGLRLWLAVYAAALLTAIVSGAAPIVLFFAPLIAVLQSTVGAYLLRHSGIDPIFRRTRDMWYLISISAVTSLIAPTVETALETLLGVPYSPTNWVYSYVATFFSVLIVTPFILRWFSKRKFSRPSGELVETIAIFGLLTALTFILFVGNTTSMLEIPLQYFLVIPLFWIALRLRPRFVTLAFLIIAIVAVVGVLLTEVTNVPEALFQVETMIIMLAISFFIVVALEEDRRVNRNLTNSQVDTLRNMLDRVKSESHAKNDFIAILAHELRNPLAPVVSGIELLKLKNVQGTEDGNTLDMMANRMGIVRRLLDDLLDVSRIAENKITLNKEQVNLTDVIKSAILSTEHHRIELHQRLVAEGLDKPLYVSGDLVRIEQIFSNLLTNASKYSNSGDTIKLTVRENEGIGEIEVADQGIGLAEGALETIFLPFHQTENGERTKKGLGIGLALVRNFVELHGGTVTAMSEGEGRGARFIVRLPLLPTHTDVKKLVKAAVPLRILIADENDAAAGNIGRLLELQGCTVTYAYEPRQAIREALAFAPDVVLLDTYLSRQEDYSVAKTMRERGYKGKLVALTDRSDATNIGEEFDSSVQKPAGLADLRLVLPEL